MPRKNVHLVIRKALKIGRDRRGERRIASLRFAFLTIDRKPKWSRTDLRQEPMLQAVELQPADLLHHDTEARLENNQTGVRRSLVDREGLTAVADEDVIESIAHDTQDRIDSHVVVHATISERDVLDGARVRVCVRVET